MMSEPVNGEEQNDAEESPFRQPTASEQRAGLGCVVAVVVVLFLLIVIGILFGLT